MHFNIKFASILCTIICLTNGCTLHPLNDKDKNRAFLTERFNEQTFSKLPSSTVTNTEENPNWYENFNDPLLTQLIVTGLSENLTINQAWSALHQSGLQVKMSRADQFPNMNLNGRLSKDKTNTGNTESWQSGSLVSATLSWEIDLWRRIRHTHAAQLSRFEATEADLAATYLLISTQISRAYFDIMMHQAMIQLIKQQINTNQQFLELTQLRKSTGQGSILDLQQQQQQLLFTQSKLPEAERNLTIQRQNLAVLLNESPLSFQPYFAKLTPNLTNSLPSPPNINMLPSPKQLLTRSPTLFAGFLRLKTFDHDIAIAAANRLPSLSLSANHTRQNTDSIGFNQLRSSNLALNIFQPIFDAGRLKNTYLLRKEALKEATHAFEQAYLTTLADIEQSIENERYQRSLLKNTLNRLSLAKQSLSEAKFQYANGLISYLNVLQSLETLQQLETQSLTVRRNLLSAYIDIILATGGPIHLPNQSGQLNEKSND